MRNTRALIDADSDALHLEMLPCDDPGAQARVVDKVSINIGRSFCGVRIARNDITYLTYTASGVSGSPYSPMDGVTLCLRRLP